MQRRLFASLFMGLFLVLPGICSPEKPNFSGTWKQNNERSMPARKGDVTLHIEDRGSEVTVETTILRSSAAPQHASQHYTTDGETSVSTGADGDEFHTSVTRHGPALHFSIEEHEDGRILHSQETWTLIENGAALERSRDRDQGTKQTIIYLHQVPKP